MRQERTSSGTEGSKIYIIEDSPAHGELVSRILNDAGFQVKIFDKVEKCEEKLRTGDCPTLIVSDYKLPDGTALDVVKAVNRRCPVVVMTSHGSEQSAVEALKAGALDYVVKSKEIFQEISHIVSRVLREWQHMCEARQAEQELIKRDEILKGLAGVLSLLLSAQDPHQVMDEVLRLLGTSSGSDRVSVFKNSHNENHDLCMSLVHEWVVDPSFSQLGNTRMYMLPYKSLSPDNEDKLGKGDTIQASYVTMTAEEQRLFGEAGIKSILSVPIFSEKEFWGFVGFDSFSVYEPWSASVIALLQMAARAVGSAIERMAASQKRLELERQMQQAQKLESLGVLAGGIAHDFNNLLMAIMGHSDLALQDLSPLSPARESIIEIEKASKRAAELCRQMLAYSGRGRFIIEQINVNELIREMMHLLRTSISKKASLKMELDENVSDISGDATQIRQVIMNLITNASDALSESSGAIKIITAENVYRAKTLADLINGEGLSDGSYLEIIVEDTGSGMSPEILEKIFDPFFTTKFTGRGLGLAAVLGIVRSHRGALEVRSEVGKGTTFRILFPVCGSDQETGEGACEVKAKDSIQEEKMVLLVDDEESVRNLGKLMIERCGYNAMVAVDGADAVRKYEMKQHSILCVLMDLTMPAMDGDEAFNEILKIDPGACVIITSGYNKAEIEKRFLGRPIAGVIEKPYSLEKLSLSLRSVLVEWNKTAGSAHGSI